MQTNLQDQFQLRHHIAPFDLVHPEDRALAHMAFFNPFTKSFCQVIGH
jgi:hypothetical protein